MLALQLAITGLTLTAVIFLLGQSIVVVHRGAAVPNFAAGAIGMFGAYVFYDLWPSHGFPWPLALVVSLGCSAAIGLSMHVLVMRRLRRSSVAAKMTASLGLMALLLAIADQYFAPDGAVRAVPTFLPQGELHPLHDVQIGVDQLCIVGLALLVWGGLAVVQRYTRFGLATTAVCENEIVAAGMGWSPDVIAGANWALGSAIATFAIILLAPVSGLDAGILTLLVVPALVAALVGQFDSLPLTLLGAVVIGIGEAEMRLVTVAPGWAEAAPLIVIILLLLVRGQRHMHVSVIDRLPSVGSGRLSRTAVVAGVGFLLLLVFVSGDWLTALSTSLAVSIALLSIVVLTGYGGQLSLAQYGLAGLSAFVSAVLAVHFGLPLALASLAAIVVTVVAGLLFAAPALRTSGATLAIATVSMLVVIQDLILRNSTTVEWLAGRPLPSLSIFGLNLNPLYHPRAYAIATLVAFVLTSAVVMNLRRSSTGRRLLAIRANPQAAASIGISPTVMKMYAFALAAVLAGVSGALLEAQMSYPDFSLFTTESSINLVLQATLGGLGWLAGAAVGGAAVPGGVLSQIIGLFVPPTNWLAIFTALGVLLVIVQSPDGLVPMQVRQVRQLTARIGSLVRSVRTVMPILPVLSRSRAAGPEASLTQAIPGGGASLARREPARVDIDRLTVDFGSVRALDDVSLSVRPGEIVGLIGPNGAGKSTLINVACGSLTAAAGTVRLNGHSVDGLSATRRAKRGLIRSFQLLELFEDMSVGENLLAASERPPWWCLGLDLLRPRVLHPTAAAVLATQALGLDDVLTRTPRTLDHGRRRLVAIARALAADPAVILLDEPAAGLDHRERSELTSLLRTIATDWRIGVLLVEHDVNLVFQTCDRVVALVNGRVVADGTPDAVRADPTVVAAYLGDGKHATPEVPSRRRPMQGAAER